MFKNSKLFSNGIADGMLKAFIFTSAIFAVFLGTLGIKSCSDHMSWKLVYKQKVEELIKEKVYEEFQRLNDIERKDLIKKFRF